MTTGWLETAEIYSFATVEARSLKSSFPQGWFLLGGSGRICSLTVSSLLVGAGHLSVPWRVDESLQ